MQRYKKNLIYTNLFVFFNKNDTLFVNLLPDIARSEKKSVHFVIALGIGRATVLCNNAEVFKQSFLFVRDAETLDGFLNGFVVGP